jgi:hypothetical protein
MIVLLANSGRFKPQGGRYTNMSSPVRDYFAILLIGALWASALVAMLYKWPVARDGSSLRRRYDVGAIVDAGMGGVPVGCVILDAVFM